MQKCQFQQYMYCIGKPACFYVILFDIHEHDEFICRIMPCDNVSCKITSNLDINVLVSSTHSLIIKGTLPIFSKKSPDYH